MKKLFLLLLFSLPLRADPAPNEVVLQLRDAVYLADHKPPPPLTNEERLLKQVLEVIELGRKACDPTKPTAQRAVWAAQFMKATDPVRTVDLGGTNEEPNAEETQ